LRYGLSVALAVYLGLANSSITRRRAGLHTCSRRRLISARSVQIVRFLCLGLVIKIGETRGNRVCFRGETEGLFLRKSTQRAGYTPHLSWAIFISSRKNFIMSRQFINCRQGRSAAGLASALIAVRCNSAYLYFRRYFEMNRQTGSRIRPEVSRILRRL
jgi:hypothetical protein